MAKRDKAKKMAVRLARNKVAELIVKGMNQKGIDNPELDGLCGFDEGKAYAILRKPPIGTLAEVMFELGYELLITIKPLNKDRLEELAKGGHAA